MAAIFWQTIKDRKISIIVYCVAGIAFLWMYIAMFPSIKEQAGQFTELLKNYPDAFLKAFGIEDLSFDTIEKFLSVEHFSIVWPILALFMGVSFAGNNLAAEVERGTAELVLARSVSRVNIFFGKYVAGLTALAVFTVCSVLAIVPLAHLHSVSYVGEHFLLVAIVGFLFAWASYSVVMLFSAMFSERSKAYMFGGGLLVVMYVLKLVSSLREQFQDVQWASFFHYYDYHAALVNGTVSLATILVFSGVIIGCTTLGVWWWQRRDIAI